MVDVPSVVILLISGIVGVLAEPHQKLPYQVEQVEDGGGDYHIIFPPIRQEKQDSLSFGSCIVVLTRECPHPDVQYFLYTRSHSNPPEAVNIGAEPGVSNLTDTAFNASQPTKILIHGYNSDMFLNAMVEIKNQYLYNDNFNIFSVDWSPMAQGPCYPAAVWNARFSGRCTSLLVQRLRELGATDIHVIGFSLGAHVAAFMANHLVPYKVPRITGLDPAMPGFVTLDNLAKLDSSDAEFVDVIHTNAFFQGKVEKSGHVDFYMNGGTVQPGCWADMRFFACSHHRAPFYFAESINSQLGFFGWPCRNYLAYLFGQCPPEEPQTLMGEYVDIGAKGMYLVITDSVSPFAVGRFEGPTIDILVRQYEANRLSDLERYRKDMEECSEDDYREEGGPGEVFPPNEGVGEGGGFDVEITEDLFDHIIV